MFFQEWELQFLRLLQGLRFDLLNQIFIFITLLGEEYFVILILCYIYWVYRKDSGIRLTYAIGLSLLINNTMKDLFRMERPIHEAGILPLWSDTATGYSFPSGHSQVAASWMTGVALLVKKRWFWYVTAVLISLVGFSRLYLNVHYPKDVIVGIALGVVVLIYGQRLYDYVPKKGTLYALTMAAFLPFLIFLGSPDFMLTFGLVLGFIAGTFIESRYVQFEPPTSLGKGLIRYVIGLFLILMMKEGLKVLFFALAGESLVILDMVRYFLLATVLFGGYPWIFKRINL